MREGMKQIIGYSLRPLPQRMIAWLGQRPERNAHRLARLGAMVRPVRFTGGVAAGRRFFAGEPNIDLMHGRYEPAVQRALVRCLAPGHVFYDIGANVGFFTIVGAHIVGAGGAVIAFEPVAENAALVRRNAALNGFTHVTVVEKAVSNTTGEEALQLTRYHAGATLAVTGIVPPDHVATQQVGVVTVDDAVRRGTMPPPDVVKIDVEGAERLVLEGMVETIRAHRPVLLYEIDDDDRTAFLDRRETLDAFVRGLGYRLEHVDEPSAGDASWYVGHTLATPEGG